MPRFTDWVEYTPVDETAYTLTMFGSHGGSVQVVEMDRDEFINLKAHLAAIRDHQAPTAGDAIQEIADCSDLGGYNCSDTQQIAMFLETARDFYRCLPHLVVTESDLLDAQLKELTRVPATRDEETL